MSDKKNFWIQKSEWWIETGLCEKRTKEKKGSPHLVYIQDSDDREARRWVYDNLSQTDGSGLYNWYSEKRVGYKKYSIWNTGAAVYLKLTYGYTPKTIRRRKSPNSTTSTTQTPEIDPAAEPE